MAEKVDVKYVNVKKHIILSYLLFPAWHGIKRKQPMIATDDTTKKKVAADKAFELTDDNFETETVQEKLSTFRRKRLAEKRYAFTDDAENITPLSQVSYVKYFFSLNIALKLPV